VKAIRGFVADSGLQEIVMLDAALLRKGHVCEQTGRGCNRTAAQFRQAKQPAGGQLTSPTPPL